MRVLVTGATGFVARYLIPVIRERGHTVIASALDAPEKAEKYDWLSGCTYHAYDLCERDKHIFQRLNKPDTLIHLAWQGLPNYSELLHIEHNLWPSYFFIKDLLAGGLSDLTVAGTCSEYGMQEGRLTENMAPSPILAYAVAKDSLRRFIGLLNERFSFTCRWLRLFYMYGTGQSPTSLFSLVQSAMRRGDKVFNMSAGDQVRDYLPVEEMAERMADCALQNRTNGIINCCSGIPVTIRELVERWLAEKNATMELNLGYYPYPTCEPMKFWGDVERLQTVMTSQEKAPHVE